MAATLCADTLWYSLGRAHGTRILETLCRFSLDPDSSVRHAKERFSAHRARYLILAKFLPGVNPLAAGLAGAVPIAPTHFLLYAAAGALLWGGTWITLGYLCADVIGLLADRTAGFGSRLVIVSPPGSSCTSRSSTRSVVDSWVISREPASLRPISSADWMPASRS